MTEANLQPSWPFYESHKQVYCLHSLAKSVHDSRKKQLYTYLAMLGATFISRGVQQGMYRKSQLYTYLGSEGHLVLPSSVTEFLQVLGKNSYTLT